MKVVQVVTRYYEQPTAGTLQLPRRTWSRCLDSGSAVRKNLRPVAVSNDCSTKESASSSSIFDERGTW